MELIYESKSLYRILDYHISHSCLLIRGIEGEGAYNIDLVFEGTELIFSPIFLNGLKVYQLNSIEINKRGIDNKDNFKVFIIQSGDHEYYIKTAILRIYKNTLLYDKSSIDMTGKGQENLIWISK